MYSRFISENTITLEGAYVDFSDLKVEVSLEKATKQTTI